MHYSFCFCLMISFFLSAFLVHDEVRNALTLNSIYFCPFFLGFINNNWRMRSWRCSINPWFLFIYKNAWSCRQKKPLNALSAYLYQNDKLEEVSLCISVSKVCQLRWLKKFLQTLIIEKKLWSSNQKSLRALSQSACLHQNDLHFALKMTSF